MNSKRMAVPPPRNFTSALTSARRLATKATYLALSRAAAAMSAVGLADWMIRLAADYAVVVFEHLNRTPTPKKRRRQPVVTARDQRMHNEVEA